MSKRILSLILAIFASAPAAFFTGCRGEETAKIIASAETTELFSESERIYPSLPDISFDGADFRLIQWYRGENHIHNYFEYYAESENGEVLNDAVYARNRTIEEKYGVRITAEGAEEPSNVCIKLQNSGDFLYHFCADIPQRLALSSTGGCFYELNSVPYLDITMPWWNSRAQTGFSVEGKLYLITGDYVLYEKQRIFGIFFNRDIAENYGLPDLYDTGADGKWTVELLNKYVKDTSQDIDGDGIMNYGADRFGLLSGSFTYISALLFGMGNTLSSKDADDVPVLSMNNEKMINSINALGNAVFSDNTTWGEVITDNWTKGVSPQTVFEQGRAMFYYEVLQVARLLDTDVTYGIIPLPKYDEGQKDYLTTVQYGNSGAISVPANNPDIEMTGILLEALAAESKYTTLPVFIDVVLKTKKAPDERAPLMLDIIYKGIVYDIAAAFDFGGINSLLNNDLYKAKANNFASGYAAKEETIRAALDKTVDSYRKIGN